MVVVVFVCCGELVVGKVVGFLLHVHVWASEYKIKYIYIKITIFFPLNNITRLLKKFNFHLGLTARSMVIE